MDIPDLRERIIRLKNEVSAEVVSFLTALKVIPRRTPVLGIDIGRGYLKLVEAEGGEGEVRVRAWAASEIAHSKADEINEQAVADGIRALLSKGGFTSRDAALLVSGPDVLFRRLLLPHIPSEEIREAVHWELKQDEGLKLEELAWDFAVARRDIRAGDIRKLEVLVAIAPLRETERAVRIARLAGLEPISIASAPFAVAELFQARLAPEDAEVTAVVDLGERSGLMSFVKGRDLIFVRELKCGAAELMEALAEMLARDGGDPAAARQAARTLCREVGIPEKEGFQTGGREFSPAQIVGVMRPILDNWVQEFTRALAYFKQSTGEPVVHQVVLSGGGSNIRNLVEFLSNRLEVTVALASPEDLRVRFAPGTETSEAGALCRTLAPALGLSLMQDKKVNLIPRELKVEKVRILQALTVRVIGVTCAALLAVSSLLLAAEVGILKGQIAQKSRQWQLLMPYVDEVTALKEVRARRLALFEHITKGRADTPELMRALSHLIPEGAHLDSLSLSANLRSVRLKGTVYITDESAEAVLSKFILSLEQSGAFQRVNLLTSQRKGEETSEFDMIAKLEL
ncbi:MAG: pilus assembly protein PilM [Candidatus Omnitrophica bacterium]|nr:pilus assembly protein PilM [Candidatus Omnitrophota bacterium]